MMYLPAKNTPSATNFRFLLIAFCIADILAVGSYLIIEQYCVMGGVLYLNLIVQCAKPAAMPTQQNHSHNTLHSYFSMELFCCGNVRVIHQFFHFFSVIFC